MVQQVKDITQTGPKALKGVRNPDLYTTKDNPIDRDISDVERKSGEDNAARAIYRNYNTAHGHIGYEGLSNPSLVAPQLTNLDYGASSFDLGIMVDATPEDILNKRAYEQPWYDQIGAGLAKGALLAGTTFLDGTVGLVTGIGTAVKEGRISGIWDNPFAQAMLSVSDASEKAMPNYYSTQELNTPFYDNFFTANFLGDKLIKNMGFTVGAFYSGLMASKALTLGGKLATAIGAVAKESSAPAMVNTAIGATLSAVNEGSIEASNNSRDWFNNQKVLLDDAHNDKLKAILATYGGTEMYQSLLNNENSAYNGALGKLSLDRLKMGNVDLLLNLPILMASNIVQFGKLYANGFKTARKATNIVEKAGLYATENSKLGAVAAITKGALSEGTEEISLQAASYIPGTYYATDVNNFYKAKSDPKASLDTLSWTKAFADGINQTVNDGSSWELFVIGSLTGAIGMPMFRSAKTAEGNFQSPITIGGGAFNEWKEHSEQRTREQEIANYMNDRVASPDFKNYYLGLVRHNKYQGDMDLAATDGSEFDYKNAEHAQMVSDISMFDSANKLEDLKTLVGSTFDTSDENLASIITNTTSTSKDGNLVGPFALYAVKSDDGSISANFGSDASKQDMIEHLTKNKDDMLKTVDNYQKIKDDIDIKTGQRLNDSQLTELTWIRGQIDNWNDRSKDLVGQIKPTLSALVGRFSSERDLFDQLGTHEGSTNTSVTPLYEAFTKSKKTAIGNIESVGALLHIPTEYMASVIANDPKIVQGLKEAVSTTTTIPATEAQDFNLKLDDIVKLQGALGTYNSKLKEYLDNPTKLAEDHAKVDKETIKQSNDTKAASLKEKLNNAPNLAEFRAALDTEDDSITKENALKSIEEEGNPMVKNHRETTQYNGLIQLNLANSELDPLTKVDAQKLFQDHFNNALDLNQLSNPNSVHINNETAFDEASEGDAQVSATRFLNALYALLKAMTKVNNDNTFKDRFATSPNIKETTKEFTEDANTKVPSSTPIVETPSPVGNITPAMAAEENQNANARVLTTRDLDDKQNEVQRPYYRPAIPELHIQGSKEGDFRPFDVVSAEKEKGVDFSKLYNYLKDSNAFNYVNEGNLTPGSELGFMLDPDFNDHTIFIVDNKNHLIVGSLDESEYSVSRYKGLLGLQERVKTEYTNRANKTGKFYATPLTRVSQIMVGRIPYSTDERSLNDIPNAGREATPIFGIVKNGTLSTNNQLDDSKILKPVDMSQKEGRMYLLIPNAKGMYSPAAIRVKHFNSTEFNLNDTTVANTAMAKHIQEDIAKLSDCQSPDDLNEAVKLLSRDLYTGNLHIDWVTTKEGNAIRFTKVERDTNGKEVYTDELTPDGKRKRKETVKTVLITEGGDPTIKYSITGNNEVSTPTIGKSLNAIRDIIEALQSFNLPVLVNLGMLNKGGYNKMLVGSNILLSNISNATVLSSWFTTDYFDDENNLLRAISPASIVPQPTRKIETPVGGKEGAIPGISVTNAAGTTYYVDLSTNTAKDDQGKSIPLPEDVKWEALAKSLYGDNINGTLMVNNRMLLPDGRVFDRKSLVIYSIDSKETKEVKDTLAGRTKKRNSSNLVIGQINENQKRVDKTRTDGEFYYILENDGDYHQYSRVHSLLGSNWLESPKQVEILTKIKTELSKLVDNPKQFNTYLAYLEGLYKVKLSDFNGKTDIKSRETIANIVRDSISGTNSLRALNAGNAIDSTIRNFFTSNESLTRPANMTEAAFSDLLISLTNIRSRMEQMGERFMTNNIVLFQKYPDGRRVAGEVDILSVDKEGNFRIYDVKTSKYSFYDFTDRYGHPANYFNNKSINQRMSTLDYYTLQLSAYKNLFESQYGVPITKLAVMPFVLSYTGDSISSVMNEKGILITYNPSVNVPLVGNVQTKVIVPAIFESSLESLNPINSIAIEYSMDTNNQKIGYFVLDGKLHRGYLVPIATIAGTQVYITKVPSMTTGYGKEAAHVATSTYYAVFPNGNTISMVKGNPVSGEHSLSQSLVEEAISKALKGNPQRVKDMSTEKTIIFDPSTIVKSVTKVETSSNVLEGSTQSGAAKTLLKEQALLPHNSKYEEPLDLGFLRKVTDNSSTTWDLEKELSWLNKVLPQLSDNDRVKVVLGLINVANLGTLAWGLFSKGVITLSDIAAKGTTYHEAFHAVFNLLLVTKERLMLLQEAKLMYGDKSDLELEEDMAEGFREYAETRDSTGLLNKIKNFFKDLYIKATNWNKIQPHLIAYYQMINQGKYVGSNFRVATLNKSTVNESTFSSLNDDTRNTLTLKGWTEERFNNISLEERDQVVKCLAF